MSETVFELKGDKVFIKSKAEVVDKFPPGIYNISATMDGIYFGKINLVSDDIIPAANSPTQEIIDDINRFMSDKVKKAYKEYGFVHKRGILMHGKGGTGKTTTITQIVNKVVDNKGIVFFNAKPSLLAAVLPVIRENSPDALICVVYEEFDEWITRDAAAMLSFLDGELQVEDVIFLGATNYISKIPERIKNRPSRFAKVVELQAPDETFRREFLKRKLKGDDLNRLEEFVQATDNMVVDQLKDVVVSVCCVGVSLHDAVNKIKEMEKNGIGIDDYAEKHTRNELDNFSYQLAQLQKDMGLKPITGSLLAMNKPIVMFDGEE